MLISRTGKRLMAFVMAFAFVLSGIAFFPKAASAADAADDAAEPAVTILGATLSTSSSAGTQSIRFGIEISHADKASACGFKMRLKDKGSDYKIISTENEGQDRVHSKDSVNKSVVYTVKVTNIPVGEANTEFEFSGFVKKIGSNEITSEVESEPKSVNGLLASINESTDGQEIKMLESGDYAGTLVYEYAKLDMSSEHSNLQLENTDGAYVSGKFAVGKNDKRATSSYVTPAPDTTDEPYYRIKTPDGAENEIGKGIGYMHDSMSDTDKYIYSADIMSDEGVSVGLISYWAWNTWLGGVVGEKVIEGNGSWQHFEVEKTSGTDKEYYFSTCYEGEKEYCIKNFVIYKVVSAETVAPLEKYTVDFATDISSGKDICNTDSDGLLTINYASQYQGVRFDVPSGKSDNYDTVSITYKDVSGSISYKLLHPNGHADDYGTMEAQKPIYYNLQKGSEWITETFTLNDSGKENYYDWIQTFELFSLGNPDRDGSQKITVKSIVFSNTSSRTAPPRASVPEEKEWKKADLTKASANPAGSSYISPKSGSIVLTDADYVEIPLDKEYNSTQSIDIRITGISYIKGQDFRIWAGGRTSSRATGLEIIPADAEGGFVNKDIHLEEMTENDGPEKPTYDKITICANNGGELQKLKDLEISAIYYKVEKEPVIPQFEVVKISDAITVDGKADEDAWNGIKDITFGTRKVEDKKTSTVEMPTAKLAWDDEHLYGFVNVKDPEIDESAKDAYNHDGMEIVFDENFDENEIVGESKWDQNPDSFHYRYTGLTGDSASTDDIAGGDAEKVYKDNIAIKHIKTDGGYSVEFSIKFKTPKTTDAIIGFDMIVMDCSKGSRNAEIFLRNDANPTDGMSYWNNGALSAPLRLVEK